MDKRKVPRHQINREFQTAEDFIREYAMNVSLGGCFIRTDDVVPVGTEVALRFTVIADELDTIEGVGRVVRVVWPGGEDAAGVGVVFTSLTETSRKALAQLFVRGEEEIGSDE